MHIVYVFVDEFVVDDHIDVDDNVVADDVVIGIVVIVVVVDDVVIEIVEIVVVVVAEEFPAAGAGTGTAVLVGGCCFRYAAAVELEWDDK